MPRNDSPDARSKLSEEAKVFNQKIDQFIALVEDETYSVPSDYNLISFLGINAGRLKKYKELMDKNGYREGFDKLTYYRENFWSKKSLDQKSATSAIFHLKQPQNGGYSDKQEKSNDPIKVEVVIKGCEGAFK